jgi:hypothetical protein
MEHDRCAGTRQPRLNADDAQSRAPDIISVEFRTRSDVSRNFYDCSVRR